MLQDLTTNKGKGTRRTVVYSGFVNGFEYAHEVSFHFDNQADADKFTAAFEGVRGVEVKAGKAPGVALNAAFVEAVRGPMQRTWDAVASDAAQLGRVTQSGAMELVLDANRMTTFGGSDGAGKRADEMVSAACSKFGYAKVSRYLSRFVRLV